jgi:membrane protein DedA with SNARE-associated domain
MAFWHERATTARPGDPVTDPTLDPTLGPLLTWIRDAEGLWPYLALAGGGASEYLVPIAPGDTITLFGAFLTVTAGREPLSIYAAINAGSIAGALCAYAFGRFVVTPAWLERRSARTREVLTDATRRFERHGELWLAANRFLPAIRAVLFVGAGMARMPVWRVVLFGGVSAMAWNALILGAAWLVGDNWSQLKSLLSRYTIVSGALVVLATIIWLVRRKMKARVAPEPAAEAEA